MCVCARARARMYVYRAFLPRPRWTRAASLCCSAYFCLSGGQGRASVSVSVSVPECVSTQVQVDIHLCLLARPCSLRRVCQYRQGHTTVSVASRVYAARAAICAPALEVSSRRRFLAADLPDRPIGEQMSCTVRARNEHERLARRISAAARQVRLYSQCSSAPSTTGMARR